MYKMSYYSYPSLGLLVDFVLLYPPYTSLLYIGLLRVDIFSIGILR